MDAQISRLFSLLSTEFLSRQHLLEVAFETSPWEFSWSETCRERRRSSLDWNHGVGFGLRTRLMALHIPQINGYLDATAV